MDPNIEALFAQNLATTRGFIEMMFSNIQREMKELREENMELKRSLEYSQTEIQDMKTEIQDLKLQLPNNNAHYRKLDDSLERLRNLEDESKSMNVRITGLTDNSSENSEQTQDRVSKLLSEKLQLRNVSIKNAYRIGKRETQNSPPRTIIATLANVNERNLCLRNSNKLKGSTVYISEDVSKATMEIRREKLPLLKQKREEGLIAYFSGVNIITKPRINPNRNQAVPPTSLVSSQSQSSTSASSNDANLLPSSAPPSAQTSSSNSMNTRSARGGKGRGGSSSRK